VHRSSTGIVGRPDPPAGGALLPDGRLRALGSGYPTQPPAITQQLLVRSLERALSQLDVKRVAGQEVAADVFTHAGNQVF
jgi:hypothetical protein